MYISSVYGYKGIDPTIGLYVFNDRDGDGFLTDEADRDFIVTEGKFHGGMTNAFSYRTLELSFLIQFANRKGTMDYVNSQPGTFDSGNQPSWL